LLTLGDLLEQGKGFTFLGLAKFKEGGDDFRPPKLTSLMVRELLMYSKGAVGTSYFNLIAFSALFSNICDRLCQNQLYRNFTGRAQSILFVPATTNPTNLSL
jgi:hypothetical protein